MIGGFDENTHYYWMNNLYLLVDQTSQTSKTSQLTRPVHYSKLCILELCVDVPLSHAIV